MPLVSRTLPAFLLIRGKMTVAVQAVTEMLNDRALPVIEC